MKPTDIKIAKYYKVTVQTLCNYKKGSIEKQRLYNAMVAYYVSEVKV